MTLTSQVIVDKQIKYSRAMGSCYKLIELQECEFQIKEQSRLVASGRSGDLYFFVLHWWAKLLCFCRLVSPCELVDIAWDSVCTRVNKASQNINCKIYAEITLDFFSDGRGTTDGSKMRVFLVSFLLWNLAFLTTSTGESVSMNAEFWKSIAPGKRLIIFRDFSHSGKVKYHL